MLTELLASLERLPKHLAVVVGIGAAFFLLQLALSLRVYLRALRQDRMLTRLRSEAERGGSGRRDENDDWLWSFPWLAWVMGAFPLGSSSASRFTRDEALGELDVRIGSDGSYLMLQRLGIMAPLLGVVLTVVGFYWLEVDQASEESLQTILVAVTPLVSGVGAGAVLALFNQALLQIVGGRMERLRMSARTWFDEAIWSQSPHGELAGTSTAVAAIQRFAKVMGAAVDRHAASSGRIEAATVALEEGASQFEASAGLLRGQIEDVPQSLHDLRDSMAASARALEELITVGVRAVSNLDVSVAAFRTTIDREFAQAAQLHYESSRSLADALGHASGTPNGHSDDSEPTNGHAVRPR